MIDDTDETEVLHEDVAKDDEYGYVTHSATFTPTQTIPPPADQSDAVDYH